MEHFPSFCVLDVGGRYLKYFWTLIACCGHPHRQVLDLIQVLDQIFLRFQSFAVNGCIWALNTLRNYLFAQKVAPGLHFNYICAQAAICFALWPFLAVGKVQMSIFGHLGTNLLWVLSHFCNFLKNKRRYSQTKHKSEFCLDTAF